MENIQKQTLFKLKSKQITNFSNNTKYVKSSKVCLFANARDEKHIREWAAHHLLIGFDNIIIFDHRSNIPLKKVFENFDKRVKIINASKLNNPIKITLMNSAVYIAKFLKVDWMIYLDADEFIILNTHKNIKHFLSFYNHADSVGVNWLFFGSNFLKKDPDDLIIQNYTRSDLFLNDHVKSFVRPSKIKNANNPHFYLIKDSSRYFGINNVKLNNTYYFNNYPVEYYNSPIYIAHYVNQSEETFTKRKVHLPRDDNGEFRQVNISEIHDQNNSIENNDPKKKYAEEITKFLKYYQCDY